MNQLFKIIRLGKHVHFTTVSHQGKRTFLNQSYYCKDSWNSRISSPVLEKVNLDDLYYELDQRFNKIGAINAVDVDIYANKVQDVGHAEELLDLVHKLRLSPETTQMFDSTSHAVIRYLLEHDKKTELLNVLDDRLNYGVFLDFYTANILMDKFYKEEDFIAGCKVAAQLMLQEEFYHPISKTLALLHCYKYLNKPIEWLVETVVEESEEEQKVRVKYLRNFYDDKHFDLRDGLKIVGKTLYEFTSESYQKDDLDRSFHILGLALCEENNMLQERKGGQLITEVLELLPKENPLREDILSWGNQSGNILTTLEERLKQAEEQMTDKDIALQCEKYEQWMADRKVALNKHIEALNIQERIKNAKVLEDELKSKEEKLWFFENKENIELAIENKKVYYPKRWFGKKKKPRKVDEGYVPPEL